MRRGQISTIDLVVASLIMVLILLSVMDVWNTVVVRFSSFSESMTLRREALQAAELLVKTPGSPAGWDDGTVNATAVSYMGLVNRENVLDEGKLEALAAADYGDLKAILGLNRDFRLEIMELGGGTLYEAGISLDDDAVLVERFALYNDTLTGVKLTLYER